MSCKLIINGQTYDREVVERVLSSFMSLPSLKSSTDEQIVENVKQLAQQRFINLDLFTPYKEQVVTNTIFSQVIRLMGTLDPKKEVKVKPDTAFGNIKLLFENTIKKVDQILAAFPTEEVYEQKFRQDPDWRKKALQYTKLTREGLEQLRDMYKDIVEPANWLRFREQVELKFKRMGIDVSSGKPVERELTEEYLKEMLAEGDVEIDDDARQLNESWQDGSAFLMNVRNTASARVKLFLSNIPKPGTNMLGMVEYMDINTVWEDLLRIGADLDVVDFDRLIQALEEKAQFKPYLAIVANQLKQIQDAGNVKLVNELITVINKAFTEQVVVMWEKNGKAIKTKVINSNRNHVLKQVVNDWLEAQKDSAIVTKNEKGETVINQEKVRELQEKMRALTAGRAENSINANEAIAWMKEFFEAIGIDMTDAMLKDIQQRSSKGFFRRENVTRFRDMFAENGTFGLILQQYLKPGTGEAESAYEDINNAMSERASSFERFALIYIEHSTHKYQTSGFKNSEGKTIYSYINRTYLEDIKRKVKTGTTYLNQLKNRAFSKSSWLVDNLMSGKSRFDIVYMDGLKQDDKNKDGVVRKDMGDTEQVWEAILKHQNSGNDDGYYNLFTLSDKTTTPVVKMQKIRTKVNTHVLFKNDADTLQDAIRILPEMQDELYKLVQGEIDRMTEYAAYLKAGNKPINDKNFNKGWKLFYVFPFLNDVRDEQLKTIIEKIHDAQTLTSEDQDYIKGVISKWFVDHVVDIYEKWKQNGIIETQVKDGKEIVTGVRFDGGYLGQDGKHKLGISGLNWWQKALYGIIDLELNYMRAQVNMLQLLGSDPALYYKTKVEGDVSNMTYEQRLSVVTTTWDEFSKRAAKFIAPGSQGIWKWKINGRDIDRSQYKTLTIADVEKDNESFSEINTTDAQEFITLQEHIDRMMSEGRIDVDIWQSITDKIEKAKRDGTYFYELTDKELEMVYQPTKPVYANATEVNGFAHIDYVKSSTFPLIPGVVTGGALDGLRRYMEQHNIQSANFESAKKVGQPNEVVTVFNNKGEFINPSRVKVSKDEAGEDVYEYTEIPIQEVLTNIAQTLNREGLKTQQEIPYQKEEITNVSQMNKLLFSGLLESKGFQLVDSEGNMTKFTGAELKALKEQVRVGLFEKAKEEVFNKMGIAEVGDALVFKNKEKLLDILQEEAIGRGGYTENDLKQLELNEKGELAIPIYMMARGEKFEGLLNSLLSKIVLLKNPGTSLVQVSGVGAKLTLSQLDSKTRSEILWVGSKDKKTGWKLKYDESKGLQYIRKEGKTVQPAQVIMSQFIRDNDGNLIDMSQFIVEEDGMRILDTSRVSHKLLQLIGARIPNQGHSSMLPIEVVGFLPSYMQNTVIVPDGITAQMGSDFDVDKLYAYMSDYLFTYTEEGQKQIDDLEAQIQQHRDTYEKKAAELYESHLPENIMADIKKAKERKAKYVAKMKWKISDKEKAKHQKEIDREDRFIEALYKKLETINAEAFKKVRAEQARAKSVMQMEIEKLKEQIANVKLSNIASVETVAYQLDKNTDVKALSEAQLNEIYKDIHWSVLTHPDTFKRITTSIDYPDIKKEVKALEFLQTKKPHWMPMSVDTQIGIFNDNKGGKTGVAIFALLSTFLANHEDKDIFVGQYNEAGEKVRYPIRIKNRKGDVMELSQISSTGKFVHPETGHIRTKNDNVQMVLGESVDNAKNKNLSRFNWHPTIMSALGGYLALSTPEGEIEDISFATRLFPQRIIHDYVAVLERLKDSTNEERVADPGAEAYSRVKERYLNQLSAERRAQREKKIEAGEFQPEIFDVKRLLDLLEIGHKYREGLHNRVNNSNIAEEKRVQARQMLDDYYEAQLDILDLFQQFNQVGSELSTVIGAISVDTKGLGKDMFTVQDKIRKLAILKNSELLGNLSNIAGEILLDRGRPYGIANPQGEIGAVLQNTLFLARNLYQDIFPIYFRRDFTDIVDQIFNTAGINKDKVGSTKFINWQRKIFNALKSYLFTNPDLEVFGDVTEERNRLLMDTDDNKSLATRLKEIKAKYPELGSNKFVIALQADVATQPGQPSQVNYNNPFSDDLDEVSNVKGFLELILSGNKELISFARDLVIYNYIVGGVQNPRSFARFIPFEYLQKDKEFMAAMSNMDKVSIDGKTFMRQFFQNNPTMAFQIPAEKAQKLKMAVIGGVKEFTVPVPADPKTDPYAFMKVERTMADQMKDKSKKNAPKFPDYIYFYNEQRKMYFLYERDSDPNSRQYTRINTLGTKKLGVVEYAFGQANLESVMAHNSLDPKVAEAKPVKKIAGQQKAEEKTDATDKVNLSEIREDADSFGDVNTIQDRGDNDNVNVGSLSEPSSDPYDLANVNNLPDYDAIDDYENYNAQEYIPSEEETITNIEQIYAPEEQEIDVKKLASSEVNITENGQKPLSNAQVGAKYLLDSETSINYVLNRIEKHSANPVAKQVIQILNDVTKKFPKAKVIVSKQFADPGRYHQGDIYINLDAAVKDNPELSREENLENVLLHEIFHAYTAGVIRLFEQDPETKLLNREERIFLIRLKKLYEQAKENVLSDPIHGAKALEILQAAENEELEYLSANDKSLYYGLTNLHEFISMLMTDRQFQLFMNGITVDKEKNESVWEALKRLLTHLLKTLSEALGVKTESTVLTVGVNNIMGLIAARDRKEYKESADPDAPIDDVALNPNMKAEKEFDPYIIETPFGDFPANPEQVAAIDKITEFLIKPASNNFEDNIMLLVGPGGTGKTASINNALRNAKNKLGKDYIPTAISAYTHTAKGELIAAGNTNASTFHSMLGTESEFINGEEVFYLKAIDEDSKFKPAIFSAKWIVIDEASMLGKTEIEMLRQRIEEAGTTPKIVFMGDYAQLPPVGNDADQDGFAIDLRKDPNKSVVLTQVMRTKNADVTELGTRYRRAVDTLNEGIDNGIPSMNQKLKAWQMNEGHKVSSENVKYHSDKSKFIDDFVKIFKSSPLNPRHTAILHYNNEVHENTIETTREIRKKLFGAVALGEDFLPGEPFYISHAKKMRVDGKEIEYGSNERFIIQTIRKVVKDVGIPGDQRTGRPGRIIKVPVMEMNVVDKFGNVVKMEALDYKVSSRLRKEYYSKDDKGYKLADGTIFKYRDYKDLQQVGITTINYGYMLSTYKVQGQTYNYPFVDDTNIIHLVGKTDPKTQKVILTTKQYAQNMYTAVSRTKEKLYVLTNRVNDTIGNFREPDLSQDKFRLQGSQASIATVDPELDIPSSYSLQNQCR